MSFTTHRTEIYVGLFVLLGAALVGGLIVRFSQPHLGASGGYAITVEVKDATGIRVGVPVRLGGVDIGRVASDPVLNEDFVLLSIPLEIQTGIRIPTGSIVKVGTSGLMGDSFVRIVPPERPTGKFLPEGHRIVAEPASSFDDLAGEAEEALGGVTDASVEIRAAADRVERLSELLEQRVFTDENLENLRVILTELRASSENLHTASDRLNPLLEETRIAIGGVGEAADTAKTSFAGLDEGIAKFTSTIGTVNPVLVDFDQTLDELRKTLTSANHLLNEMEKGDGVAAALLQDSDLKRDLEGFLDKLNRNGLLFYPREGGAIRLPGESDGPGRDEEEKRPFSGIKRQP